MEKRSRKYNFRIRGLPETILDVAAATQDLMKSLIPNVPLTHLELDRAHRALEPPRKDGSPRDNIAKPHFYAIKEEVMKQSRAMPQVICQGHPMQIIANLSPSIIQRRRTLKPILNALTQRDITYRWAFPFVVKFSYKGQNQAFSNLAMGEKAPSQPEDNLPGDGYGDILLLLLLRIQTPTTD